MPYFYLKPTQATADALCRFYGFDGGFPLTYRYARKTEGCGKMYAGGEQWRYGMEYLPFGSKIATTHNDSFSTGVDSTSPSDAEHPVKSPGGSFGNTTSNTSGLGPVSFAEDNHQVIPGWEYWRFSNIMTFM